MFSKVVSKSQFVINKKFSSKFVFEIGESKHYGWTIFVTFRELVYNKGIKYLLCVIDLFSKYAWVIPLKDKKGSSIANAFQKVLSSSNRKPNKIWVDQGSEFYNSFF